MSGPFMHVAAMEQCQGLILQLGLGVDVGSKISNMLPDTHGSHGWNFPSGGGDIIDRMIEQYRTIKEILQEAAENYDKLNKDDLSRAVQYLCHYTEDAHTIGQISSEFWGKYDNRIDAATECCWNKKAYSVQFRNYDTLDNLKTALLISMRSVYDKHRGKAKKWYYPFSGQCRDMARNAVKCGAEFAAAFVRLATL